MLKLLIAVDGSEHAQRAIEVIAKMARAGAPLEVDFVNVRAMVFYGAVPVDSVEEIEAAQKKAQDQILADAQTRALGCGLPVRSIHRAVGMAASEIVRVAAEQAVDQLVMGTHGRGAIGSLFLGSVAQRVVHLSQVPVLLVR